MAEQKFQAALEAMEIPTSYALDRVTTGWLLLIGRKVDWVAATPAPLEWRHDPIARGLSFLDWLAWNASRLGWEAACEFGLKEADRQQLGRPGVGCWSFRQPIKQWLKDEW